MHFYKFLVLSLAAEMAIAQRPAKGTGRPKGAGGLGMFEGLSKMFSGDQGAKAFANIIKQQGFDPNQGITSMVCQTWAPGNKMGKALGAVFGSPIGTGPDEQCMVDKSGGSGPYKANYTEEPTLPNHTIYAPMKKPNVKLPVILWANGFCMSAGTMFTNFLNEIASHGFLIVANGPVKGGVNGFTTYQELIKSMDWVNNNRAARKWGDLDLTKLTVAGQSCGGEEAYVASRDPRVKLTALFNSPVFGGGAKTQKNPIAYFLGGPKDMAQRVGDNDYRNLPSRVPALKGTIPIGHIGSYYQRYGGRMGKAAVAFFKWQLKGDQQSKRLFCSPSKDSVLGKAGFTFVAKNGFC